MPRGLLVTLALSLVPLAPGAVGEDAPAADRAPAAIASAEDLLRALERADENIRTLSARVRYDRWFRLQGDRHVREGTLHFAQTPAQGGVKDRRFAIHFDTLYVGDRRQDDPQTWAFDGRWLTEVRPAQKRWTKREIAREGEDFDPLRVGEGPMPIPIGQRAADILSRYRAELLAPTDGLEPEQIAGLPFLDRTWQLRLTPRPGSPRGDFQEIRLWYERDSLLPRLARTVNRGGDESFVVLVGLRVNEPIPTVALEAPEPEGEGWETQVERLGPER